MKKIINYLKYKLFNKMNGIVLLILLIYQFFTFCKIKNGDYQFNLYDIMSYKFNYISLFYIISICFLFCIYNIDTRSKFNQYILLRLKSKYIYFNMNVGIIAMVSFLFIFFFDLLALVECIGKCSLANTWSEFFIKNSNGNFNIFFTEENFNMFLENITPIKYILILNLLIFLYFLTLGLIFLAIHSFTNKKQLSLIGTLAFIGLNVTCDSAATISKYTFTNNIYIFTSNSTTFNNLSYLYTRIIYWIILILLLYIIGLIKNLKEDYIYEN